VDVADATPGPTRWRDVLSEKARAAGTSRGVVWWSLRRSGAVGAGLQCRCTGDGCRHSDILDRVSGSGY
jgi:hypothetical protein